MIVLNDTEYSAFDWTEAAPVLSETSAQGEKHNRGRELLAEGVDKLGPGEVYFRCDQTFGFDTTFSVKGDGRKFVVIASHTGKHVAKPY